MTKNVGIEVNSIDKKKDLKTKKNLIQQTKSYAEKLKKKFHKTLAKYNIKKNLKNFQPNDYKVQEVEYMRKEVGQNVFANQKRHN